MPRRPAHAAELHTASGNNLAAGALIGLCPDCRQSRAGPRRALGSGFLLATARPWPKQGQQSGGGGVQGQGRYAVGAGAEP
ncbi:MAG: hypothetical protein ACRDR6_28445 [Pseudonocardiaceae bacterium]